MALIGVPEWIDDEFSWDQEWRREYTRTYRAFFDLADDAFYVRTHFGVSPLSVHPEDRGARVVKISGKLQVREQVAHPTTQQACFAWIITINYGYISPLDVTATGNPLAKPPTLTIEPEDDLEIVEVDVHLDGSGNGTPILNSAGVPYDPPVERLAGKGVLNVGRNEAGTFDFVAAYDKCYYRVNASEWNGFAPKTILAKPFRLPEIQYSQEANVWYYPMQYQFFYNPKGWAKKILDQGYEELDPSDSTKTRQILVDGQVASKPQLLDGSGRALPPKPSADQVVFDEYDIYEAIDFGYFNLDALFTLPTL